MRKHYHSWLGRSGVDAWDVDRLIKLTAELPVEQVAVAEIHEVDSVYWFDDWQLHDQDPARATVALG